MDHSSDHQPAPQPQGKALARMGDFDFPNSKAPELFPLDFSHEVGSVEAQLKQLVAHLWAKHLAQDVFDVSVIGAAHLGSFEQVRRMVNQDGLALVPNNMEEPATRYLYRAWKSQNHQGRGLHFLRTYLQMLFPNQATAVQLWMRYDGTYPDDAYSIVPTEDFWFPLIEENARLAVDGRWKVGVRVSSGDLWGEGSEGGTIGTEVFLTSRVLITLDFGVDMDGIGNLMQLLRNVMPARLVPVFQYIIQIDAPNVVVSDFWIDESAEYVFDVEESSLIVTENPEFMWFVRSEGAQVAPEILAAPRIDGWLETYPAES